jgi:hypothetical protein
MPAAPELEPERLAHNEATYRRINEAIERGRATRTGLIGFICECGQLGCNEVIELTLDEYEEVRSDAHRFAVAPGHATLLDRVVSRGGRFSLVAKVGTGAEIAERTDPRSSAR